MSQEFFPTAMIGIVLKTSLQYKNLWGFFIPVVKNMFDIKKIILCHQNSFKIYNNFSFFKSILPNFNVFYYLIIFSISEYKEPLLNFYYEPTKSLFA